MSEIDHFLEKIKEIAPEIKHSEDPLLQTQHIINVCREARRLINDNPFHVEVFQRSISMCKEAVSPSYILQFSVKDEDKIVPKQLSDIFIKSKVFYTPEETLDKVVLDLRGIVQAHSSEITNINPYPQYGNISGFKSFDLGNKCSYLCDYASGLLKSMKVKHRTHCIYSAFSMHPNVSNYLIKHYFIIADLCDKKYLLDCSYSQFFMLGDNILETLGIEDMELPFPGIYMLQDESRIKTARSLLERGWIEATDENMKNYFDGFALSFRNGIYYEDNNFDYLHTGYSISDYRSFILGGDSQLKHEEREKLGYQGFTTDNDVFFSKGTILFEDKSRQLIKSM